MNTLANHGYIARNGKGLTFLELVRIQCEVYNISVPLAASLAFEAVFLCGNGRTVDLHQLRQHNIIEHDASLSRDDVITGDSWTIDRQLISDMFPEGSDRGLTFRDIAAVRVKRERLLPKGKLDWAHNRIALGEASLVIGVWGLGGNGVFENNVVPYQRIRSFFVDERLPPDWMRPEFSLGFLKTVELGGKMRAEMDAMLEAEAKAARLRQAEENRAQSNGNVENEPSPPSRGESSVLTPLHSRTLARTTN